VRILLATAVLGLAIAGRQRAPALAPAPSAPVAIVGSLTERLKSEGDALMKQHRYDEAAVKYQAALNEATSDIPIRFALAVALSHTPRREEDDHPLPDRHAAGHAGLGRGQDGPRVPAEKDTTLDPTESNASVAKDFTPSSN